MSPAGPRLFRLLRMLRLNGQWGAMANLPPSFHAEPAAEPPSGHVCDYCKRSDGTEQQVAYGGMTMWLHPECQWPLMKERT
jgi:hypothetical protein